MPGAEAILAETLARIEHKVDLLLSTLGFNGEQVPQLGFAGVPCPVCKRAVEYQIDLINSVVVRKCGCSTGKQPPLIPLVPVAPITGDKPHEHPNRNDAPGQPPEPDDRGRRQGR